MPSKELKSFLNKANVDYTPMHHAVAYTASEVAGSQHVKGEEMLKPVIVKCDGKMVMCVVPAIHWIDFDQLKKVTGAKNIELASEEELSKWFTGDELGAEPPIGKLYQNMPMYAEECLKSNECVVFNAGSHTETIKMKGSDYLRVCSPKFGHFGKHV